MCTNYLMISWAVINEPLTFSVTPNCANHPERCPSLTTLCGNDEKVKEALSSSLAGITHAHSSIAPKHYGRLLPLSVLTSNLSKCVSYGVKP